MAENRNLHVNLSVKANTSDAEKSLQKLQNTLTNLGKLQNVSFGKNLSKEILEASNAALTLKRDLEAATNVNTGKLDLSKLKQSLSESGQTLETYRQQLVKLGPEGEQAFIKLAQSISQAELPLKRTNTMLAEFAGTLKNTARWQISSSILHGFMGAIQSAYGYAQDLNRSLNDIQIVTQHNSDYMAKFAEEANKAAKELNTTTTQYTNASLIFYQQGLSDAEVKKRTDVVIKMANASRQSAEEVSSQMTAVWNNFADGSKTLEYYADVMTALGAATASSSSEIAQGLQKFASIGETVGLSYEYAASALATITATTRESADTVGNALKTLFARIQGLKLGDTLEDGVDLNKYSEALSKVGVNVLDANGQLKDMDNILDELGAKWQELDREQQTALAQTVAGVRQYAQFMTLMNNWDFMKENLNTSYNAEGTLQKQADTYAQSWEAAQKRVKAAAQAIYKDLLDDKFFVSLLNGFEKVLTGVDGFIKSIGGLQGVLATAGTLIFTVFEKQISTGIENATHNLMMFTNAGKEAYREMQKSANNEIINFASETDSNGLNNMVQGYKRIAEIQNTIIDEADKMSDKEKEIAGDLIERQHALEEIVKKSGEELDIIRQRGREVASNARSESKDSGQYNRQQYAAEYNALEQSVKNYEKALYEASEAQKLLDSDQKLTETSIQNLDTALKKFDSSLELSEDQIKNLKAGGEDAKQELKNIADLMQGQLDSAQKQFSDSTGVSAGTTQQLTDNIIREEDALRREKDAVNNAEIAHNNAIETLKRHTDEVQKHSQAFVRFAGGITSTISGITSLGRAYDTITDKEKSFGEKILPTISSLAMGLPMLVTGITNLSTSFGGALAFIETLPGLFGGVISSIATSFTAAFGPAGWVAIGIGAAIAGLIALTEHFSEKTESDLEKAQKSYEKMANASKQAMEDADKLAQKYDSVNEALSKYEDAVAALNACTTGTEEWYKALDNVNTALNNILQQSPELAQFIDTSGNIDLEAAHEYLEILQNNQMMTMFAGNIGTAVTNQEDASVNREELKNDIIGALDQGFQVVAEKEGIEGQRVYANGYNYGYASDEVLNSGTFVGGVIENIHLDDLTIDELSSKINENPNLTVDEVRDLLFDVIDSNYFGEEKEFTIQSVSKDAEGNLQWGEDEIIAREDFINNIIDQNFTEILNKFAPKVEAAEKEMDIAADAVKGMATGAINYKLSQEKNLMTFDELGDASKDVLAAYMGSKLPDQIQKLADSYEKESEMSHEELWAKYNNVMGTNYKMTSDEDGKFTYQDENGSEQEIDISAVAYEIATITTLTDNWDESLKTAEDELTNLLSKTSGPFVQYLSDMSHHFENMSKTDVNNFLKMVDGFNGEANNATSAKEILKWLTDVDKGLGMTEEMAKAYGFDSLQEMAERIKQDYDDYQTGIDNLISSVPTNIKESFENLANNSDLTLSELTGIKDSLVHAVAVGGKEAGETLMSIFENAEDAGALADEINKIDWNETSVDGFVDQMVELGLIAPGSEEALKGVLEQLQEISLINIGQAIAYYNADQKAINAAKSGSNISQEDYDNTSDDIREFFTLMADGTYKMTGDAEEFYKVANESSIQGFKDNIVKLKEQEESYNRISERGVDYFSNGSFYNSEQNSYDKQGFLDTIEVLKSAGVDMETIDKWMSDLKDDGLITQDTIKEIQKSLVDCAENGFNTLTENAKANSEAQEQNRIALLSAAKTYEDFKALVDEGYASKEDQDLWEQIGFDPSTVKDAEDLINQIKNEQLKTQEAIKAGWEAVKGSTDELSISGFKTLLDSFEETDDKAAFAEEAIKKVSLSATDLLALDKTGIKGLLSEETWESICKEIDATGLTLSEIDSKYKNILPTSIYEKWAAAAEKATLETITNVKDLETEFENGNIKADSFSSKLQELFKNGDITLERALQSVYGELENGEIEVSDARDIINALLSNSSVTSEQKIKALNDEISKGLGNAQTYHDLITEIMGSKEMTSQQKLSELGNKEYKNGYGLTDKYSAWDRYIGYSQLAQDESLSLEDRQKALEGMKRAMDELGESAIRTREYADAVMKASQDAGDTAEETATKMFEAFGGANMNPDNWVTFGNIIETLLSDMEGDAETKMKFIQELLEGTGLTLEDVGLKAKDFGTKTKEAFQLDTENLTIGENFKKLNEAFETGIISDIDEYGEHLKILMSEELDWTVTHENAVAALFSFQVGLERSKGTLNEHAKALGEECTSIEDLNDLMAVMDGYQVNNETKTKAETAALLKLGNQYKSCTQEVKKYEAALRSGNKTKQETAKQELTLATRSAEQANNFGLEEEAVKTLAQSYMELGTIMGSDGKEYEMTAEMATDLATRYLNLNNGIADLQSNWEDYSDVLTNLQSAMATGDMEAYNSIVADQRSELEGLRGAMAEVLNLTDSTAISDQFLAENAQLVEKAMNGDAEAVAALQVKMAEGLEAEITVNDEPFHAKLGEDDVYLSNWLENLPEGVLSLDDTEYLQTLVNAMVEAGYANEEIEEKLKGLGIEIEWDNAPLQQAVADSQEAAELLTQAGEEAGEGWAEGASTNSEVVSETNTNEDEHKYVSTDVSTNPLSYQVTVPEYHMSSTDNGFAITGGPKQINLTYDEIKVDPQEEPAKQTTTDTTIAHKIKTAHKTHGGNISHKNLSGGNKRTSSGGNSRPSRAARQSTPRTSQVRVPDVSSYIERKTYDQKTHDQKYIAPERLEDYKKDPVLKDLPNLKEYMDEIYTTRKKFYNERYDKDKKVSEKEYETKDSSMFKRTSEEIEQYHDINNILDKIGYKLDEINQRKSRAFGKAHIDAINEEKKALEEQLAAQNQYLNEMGSRRKELQEQMKAQGWEFDENGSISNYVSKKTADVAQYNAGMEQFVEQANINRAEWNKQAHEITDTYNQMNRDAIDVYNSAMNELTDSTNSQYAIIDQAKNAAQKTMVDAYNNTLTSAAANKFNAEVQANAEYETIMKAAVEQKNAADREAISARDALLTSAEEARVRAINDAIAVRESALSDAYRTYQNATAGLEGEYEEGLAKYYQSIVDKAKAAYDDSAKAAEDAYKNATGTAENAYSNTTKKIENDYDLLTKKADVAFKNAKTDAEADLKRKNAEAAQEYKAAQQEATHQYNVAKQQADRIYTEGKRLIDEGYDDQSHEIKNNLQDMKDLATDFYDDSIEQIDKTFESAEHLNEIAKEYTEFAYDESEKMRSEYESLEDTMAQAMLDAQELRNKIYDNALEVIDYTLNLKVQLSNEVMTALTALLDSLGDAADKATDRIATLGQQMYQFTYQTKANRDAIYDLLNSQKEVDSNTMNRFMNGSFTQDDLNKLFNLDEFTSDKIANLETYRDNLVSLISEQRALKESMFEVVSGAFSEYQTSLNLQIDKITNLTKVTQTYKNIVNIVGKKVLDASGELSETLSKAAFETQRDQTHTYKSILDEIDSNIADMKQKQAAFDIDSEMFKDFQKRIDDMEAERRSAQDNWLSSWEAEMQAAADYYANAIDTITKHFDESISGLIGSLDLLNKEYERQKKIEDIYVEDYEKIYQLSKLTRDIEEAIDNSDHVKNKQKLKKLQDEINQASKDGVKLSQYDLDVLRKKFELELARDELEESRNAKSQVRMMRDAEGNYGYVYTADANAVADAEQNYEDKLHELQVLNTDYIKQLEDNYLELQQNVRDEIASLDITQFATEEEYLAEVERIQSAALELQERMSQQMGNALGNNRDLYENEWTAYSQMTGYKISADEDYLDKFNETTYSVLTGFQAMSEAKDQFIQSLAEAILGAIEAYRTTTAMQEIAMQDGGTSMADFAQDAIQSTEQVIDKTEALATEAENLSETYQDAFGQIADSAADFAENYVKNIQPVIDSNLQLLDTIAKIIEHQANLNGQSGDGSGSGGVTSGVKSNGTTWSAFGSVGDVIGAKTKIAEYLPWIAAVAKFADYTTNSGGWGTGDTRRSRLNEVFGPGAAEDFEKYWNEYAATGALGEYWDPNNWQKFSYETMKKMKFDTGGYTGQWNSVDGKLALLHEKELVLNQSDTNNILEAVDMIRKITQMIDLNALSAESFLGNMLTAANISTANNDVLQQEVHITAEFPNATDRDEIIAAFDNLTNLAMQYAGKQNYV